MTEVRKPIATWILVVSGLIAIMELIVSVALCLAPESILETVDLGAKGVDYVIYMWAARQFALGFIFAYATWKRSVPMLTLAYIFFLVMFVGDFLVGISQGESSLVISAVVMCVVSAAMLFVLKSRK